MRKPLDELGTLQRQVLEIVWDRGEATVHQVLDAVSAGAERRPAYTTILSVMQKLSQTGWLRHRREGRQYVYTATRTREQASGSALRRFVSEVFAGDRVLAMQEMISAEPLDETSLRQLRELIDEKLQSAAMNDLTTGYSVWLTLLGQLGLLPLLTIVAAHTLRRRPAHAHAVLVAGLAATITAPVLAVVVAALGLGVLPGGVIADGGAATVGGGGVPVAVPASWPGLVAPVALTVWLVVSVTLLVRLVVSFRRSWRLLRRSTPIACPQVESLVGRTVAGGGRRRVVVALSDGVASPAIFCWSAPPRLLVPAHLREWLVGDRLAAVVRHELAHDARRDHWWRLLADVAVCVLPWHPLVHLIRRQIRQTSELACDAVAVAAEPIPARYADTLLRLAPRRRAPRPVLVATYFDSDLSVRIETLLRGRPAGGPAGGRWIAGTTIAAVVTVGAAALAQPRPLEFRAHPAWTAADLDAAPVRVFPAVLDLGVVAPGGTGRGTLHLANVGTRTVHVVTARAGCSCTTIDPFPPGPLAPGEMLTLSVAMQAPPGLSAENRKTIEILFEDQEKLQAVVHLVTTGH